MNMSYGMISFNYQHREIHLFGCIMLDAEDDYDNDYDVIHVSDTI